MIIQNVSYKRIENGNHYHSDNIELIQIVDPCKEFPISVKPFKEIHRFEFCDVSSSDSILWDGRMSESTGREIIFILRNAYSANRDIIVHCMGGISRSGAVVEIGLRIGFKDSKGDYRNPNIYMVELMSSML